MPGSAERDERVGEDVDPRRSASMRALEEQFADFIPRLRRLVGETAQQVQPGMSAGTYQVFTAVARCGPIAPSGLADMLSSDKAHVSRAIRDLERFGLVERVPDGVDGRSIRITATAEGISRWSEARAAVRARPLTRLEEWRTDDVDRLTVLLDALWPAAEKPESST